MPLFLSSLRRFLRDSSSRVLVLWPYPRRAVSVHGAAFLLLQVGLSVTFIWISVFIYRNPAQSAHLVLPWVLPLLPMPLETIMLETAVIDAVIGVLLLVKRTLWFASLLATLHLLLIFVVTGINAVTVRNIGLLALSSALFLSMPAPRRVRRFV